ncbi:hypothetical protein ATCC90586_011228 [Pythium insidiosum]|nr:hypothetical protein ATCC90586_011228 [Pythium insidiosum]
MKVMDSADGAQDYVVAFDRRGIVKRCVFSGCVFVSIFFIPAVVWISTPAAPPSDIAYAADNAGNFLLLGVCLLLLPLSVFMAYRRANTQRCVVTATAIKFSMTLLGSIDKTVPLDSIEQVNLKANVVDRSWAS